MKRVTLAEDPFEPSSWTVHDVEDVREFLRGRYDRMPETARIYHGHVAEACDVTPKDEGDIERLGELPGPFYVVVYPAGIEWLIVAVIAVVAIAAAAFLLVPPVPESLSRNTQTESPNNSLSERRNTVRVNGRIPDIFGTVRSTPDLLSLPYRIFRDHEEVEIAYMCVGRGAYEIGTIYDDTTPVTEIEGAQIEIYGPNTSPRSGDAPEVSVGDPITEELVNISHSSSINGQTLNPPNFKQVVGTDNIRFEGQAAGGGRLRVRDTEVFVWPTFFDVGDTVVITNGIVDAKNFNGTYVVDSVDNDFLYLVNPGAVAAAWLTLGTSGVTSWTGPTVSLTGTTEVGPFFIDIPSDGFLIANLVALSGLYKADGNEQVAFDIDVMFDMTPVDSGGTPTGATVSQGGVIRGSNSSRGTRASTTYLYPGFSGRATIVGRRVTEADYVYSGSVVDEIKWRDLYIAQTVEQEDFGDVTTVMSVSRATQGALALKERKLNMLVTRKIPRWDSGTFSEEGNFSETLYATNAAADIIAWVCADPYIGRQPDSRVDRDSINSAMATAEEYFGTSLACEFCYTFDKENLSFEETLAIIAQAVFCTAYRQGSVIKLSFEQVTSDSVLLFNHRNKLPGSETRTVTFGTSEDVDGVAYEYVSDEDDAVLTLYVPQGDSSALKARKIESIGVRNYPQAYFHAWRAWNKIRYQNTAVQFDATQEADLLVVSDRILVADNTRPDTKDGEIISQNVLELTLSQEVDLVLSDQTYTVFVQHTDGTVEGIAVTGQTAPDAITLAQAPSQVLSLADDSTARATYMIVGSGDVRTTAFLMTEKEPLDTFAYTVSAVNYDARYYQNDRDLKDAGTADNDLATADITIITADEG